MTRSPSAPEAVSLCAQGRGVASQVGGLPFEFGGTGLNATPAYAQDKPNIVFIFADNLGYGELGAYGGGILRGAPTPRNPQERADESLNTAFRHAWVLHAMFKSLAPFQESLAKYPPIPMGASDPYQPPAPQKP